MANPLPVSNAYRGAGNGTAGRPGADRRPEPPAPPPEPPEASAPGPEELQELDRLRDENSQLRALCLELEQALQEASNREGGGNAGDYEAILEEKSETIRHLHQQVEELQAALVDAENRAAEAVQQTDASRPQHDGPVPREEELLTLSEELERERRQLQEDEQTLMDQMREMEVGMARERAELARQRNDLQRLQSEVRHELERLERSGALQHKIENLKSKLQDVTARRGAARVDGPAPSRGAVPPPPAAPAPPPAAPPKGNGLMGRLFGQGGR